MRQFNKIFVIALPRCATVSISRALGSLGIRIAHLGKIDAQPNPLGSENQSAHFDVLMLQRMRQQIEAQDYQLDILEECCGLADYPVCCPKVICQLEQQYPGSLFINARRDDSIDCWLQSVEIQFVGTELLAAEASDDPIQQQFIEVMRCYRRWTFGSETFRAPQYRQAYIDYQAWTQRHFAGKNQLLEFTDLEQLASLGFPRLCEFLEIESVPGIDFPRINSHGLLPKRAFYTALSNGRVSSQTGLQPHA